MTPPREPDRYEAKAREVVMQGDGDLGRLVRRVAAALRAAEASALERAAQAFDDRGPKLLSGYETARLLRYPYVPSPAAAPEDSK